MLRNKNKVSDLRALQVAIRNQDRNIENRNPVEVHPEQPCKVVTLQYSLRMICRVSLGRFLKPPPTTLSAFESDFNKQEIVIERK